MPVNKSHAKRAGSRRWSLLLLLPYIALLWVPSYAKSWPKLFGFPFFYWYQFLWVPLSALVLAVVYWKER
jgi:Protein of unknown function (DUF3311)